MLIIAGFIISFIVLMYGVLNGIYIGYGLFISLIIFSLISYKRGSSISKIKNDAWSGGIRSFVVIKVFVLIGMVTASWLIAGTIPAIVYYSMKVMNPNFFVLFAFLASSLVSYMLGTSLGTASTIGVVLIIMARGGDININLTAGAILSGIYFGDRTSPMSSCANLVANQSETELYPMLKGFRKTTIIPYIIATLIYLVFSFSNPLSVVGNSISEDLKSNFVINFIVLLPAIIMLILSSLQFSVKKAMLISIIAGSIISLVIQGASITELVRTLVFGYSLPPSNPLVNLIKGGGLLSMVKTGLAVFTSCAMAGVLEGMDLFNKISALFKKYNTKAKVFLATAITSFVSACYGGNQSISVVITSQIMKSVYDDNEISRKEMAVDISNTAVLFAPMIPWNIAVLVPSATLDVSSAKIIPYAFYLFLPFVVNYIRKRITHNH